MRMRFVLQETHYVDFLLSNRASTSNHNHKDMMQGSAQKMIIERNQGATSVGIRFVTISSVTACLRRIADTSDLAC